MTKKLKFLIVRFFFNFLKNDGTWCNICMEKYVGLAQDCRCTNYGKTD